MSPHRFDRQPPDGRTPVANRTRLKLRAAHAGDDAMTAALRLLSRRAQSRAEMRGALEAHGFSSTVVTRVLGRLRELGYINDRKFAAECAERLRSRGFGSLRIRAELARRGVEEGLAAGVIPEAREERVLAKTLMEARFGGAPVGDRRRQAEVHRFLAGRGFPEEVLETLFDRWNE
jgi:regulatory protein